MTKPLLKKFYFMSPVQVVKVTTHNIEQAAEWCGGTIKTTESRRNPGRTDKYIDVPVPKGAALVMAFPGMFITKRVVITLENEIKVTFGVFRKDFFEKNYWAEPIDAVDACWVRLANEEIKPEVDQTTGKSTTVLNIHVANPGAVGQALEAARAKLIENKDTMEVGVINVLEQGKEMVTEVQFPEGEGRPLTPYEQRALITEDGVEEATVPETANVVLPEVATHPTLRVENPVFSHVPVGSADNHAEMLRLQNTVGRYEDPRTEVQRALDKAAYDERLKNPGVAVLGDGGWNEFQDELPEIDEVTPLTTMQEVLADAAEKIDSGPEAGGLVIDSPIVGSASRHRDVLANGPSAAGRSSAQAIADKAAYEAEMKEIQDGDPGR